MRRSWARGLVSLAVGIALVPPPTQPALQPGPQTSLRAASLGVWPDDVPKLSHTRKVRSKPAAAVSEGRKVPLSLQALLACIRSYEGGYRSNTGNGFYGAYQFLLSTWNGVAKRRAPQWIDVFPSDAPKQVQDQFAIWLYRERGLQPWPTPNRLCR